MTESQVLVFGTHYPQYSIPLVHVLVKFTELIVAQTLVAKQIPLPSAVMKAEIIAFSREVNPLWVAELISHEV